MSCPTCDHTMTNLGLDTAGRRTFWCPRCGTMKSEAGDHEDIDRPKLISRVSDLLSFLNGNAIFGAGVFRKDQPIVGTKDMRAAVVTESIGERK